MSTHLGSECGPVRPNATVLDIDSHSRIFIKNLDFTSDLDQRMQRIKQCPGLASGILSHETSENKMLNWASGNRQRVHAYVNLEERGF